MDKEHHILQHFACLHVSWALWFLTLSYLKSCSLLPWKSFQDVNFQTSLVKGSEEKFFGPLSFVYALDFILFNIVRFHPSDFDGAHLKCTQIYFSLEFHNECIHRPSNNNDLFI